MLVQSELTTIRRVAESALRDDVKLEASCADVTHSSGASGLSALTTSGLRNFALVVPQAGIVGVFATDVAIAFVSVILLTQRGSTLQYSSHWG